MTDDADETGPRPLDTAQPGWGEDVPQPTRDWTSLDPASVDPLVYWRTVPSHALPDAMRVRLEGALLSMLADASADVADTDETAAVRDRVVRHLAARAHLRHGPSWRRLAEYVGALVEPGQRADVRATLCWLALHHGDKWSAVPLVSRLGSLLGCYRQPWHADLVEVVADALPDDEDPERVLTRLGLHAETLREAAAAKRHRIRGAAPPGYDVLRAALGDEAPPQDAPPEDAAPEPPVLRRNAVRVVRGQLGELKGDMRRCEALDQPLPVRPLPDPDELAPRLLTEFPWCGPVVERIAADIRLARRVGGEAARLPPTVLLGRPGVGKSRFALRLAALLGSLGGPGHGVLTAAGMADNRTLAGTARGWSTSSPSWPARVMAETRCANPLLVLDELCKVGGSDHNGRPTETLMAMTEPTTAAAWTDEGLGVALDLSQCSWLFTANNRGRVDPILRARLRWLEVPAPRPQDYGALSLSIRTDLAREFGGATHRDLPELPDRVGAELERGFRTGQLSARGLARAIRRAVELAAEGEARETRH